MTPGRQWYVLGQALASTRGPSSDELPGRRCITGVPILAAGDPGLSLAPLGGDSEKPAPGF